MDKDTGDVNISNLQGDEIDIRNIVTGSVDGDFVGGDKITKIYQ